MTAASELRAADTEHNADEQTPAKNKPVNPRICPIVSSTNSGISWSPLDIRLDLYTRAHNCLIRNTVILTKPKSQECQLDGVAVSVLREYCQAREAHGQRQECSNWPTKPQSLNYGIIVLHGQVTLYLDLVGTIYRDVRKYSTQHKRPPRMPDCRIDLKTI